MRKKGSPKLPLFYRAYDRSRTCGARAAEGCPSVGHVEVVRKANPAYDQNKTMRWKKASCVGQAEGVSVCRRLRICIPERWARVPLIEHPPYGHLSPLLINQPKERQTSLEIANAPGRFTVLRRRLNGSDCSLVRSMQIYPTNLNAKY